MQPRCHALRDLGAVAACICPVRSMRRTLNAGSAVWDIPLFQRRTSGRLAVSSLIALRPCQGHQQGICSLALFGSYCTSCRKPTWALRNWDLHHFRNSRIHHGYSGLRLRKRMVAYAYTPLNGAALVFPAGLRVYAFVGRRMVQEQSNRRQDRLSHFYLQDTVPRKSLRLPEDRRGRRSEGRRGSRSRHSR